MKEEMKMNMKKKMLTAAALLLGLVFSCSAACAGGLADFLSSAEHLFFLETNVTINGTAVFSLDGASFKTAGLRYVQAGTNSLQRLRLQAVRKNGTSYENGYLIVNNGPDCHVIEPYSGLYKQLYADSSETILSRNVAVTQLMRLAKALADEAENTLHLPAKITDREEGGKALELQVSREDLSPLVRSSLNLFWDYIVRRYFGIDYTSVSASGYVDIGEYETVKEGILYTTKDVDLKQLTLKAEKDRIGRLLSLDGQMLVELKNKIGGTHELGVVFHMQCGDYGTSAVAPFVLTDYAPEPSEDGVTGDSGYSWPWGFRSVKLKDMTEDIISGDE